MKYFKCWPDIPFTILKPKVTKTETFIIFWTTLISLLKSVPSLFLKKVKSKISFWHLSLLSQIRHVFCRSVDLYLSSDVVQHHDESSLLALVIGLMCVGSLSLLSSFDQLFWPPTLSKLVLFSHENCYWKNKVWIHFELFAQQQVLKLGHHFIKMGDNKGKNWTLW